MPQVATQNNEKNKYKGNNEDKNHFSCVLLLIIIVVGNIVSAMTNVGWLE